MRSSFYHIQLNINYDNIDFYKELMSFLGWTVIFEQPKDVIGFRSHTTGDLWFCQRTKHLDNDYDGSGMNHVSIRAERQANIDSIGEFLKKHNVPSLFDTPKQRPEFSNPGETYYQIMFKTMDNLLLEIVYIGSKE